jgi:hypothetical protein
MADILVLFFCALFLSAPIVPLIAGIIETIIEENENG